MNHHQRLSATTTATSKGQTTIPKAMRDALGIKDGTQLRWVLEDGVLKVTAKTLNLADFAGMLGPPPSGTHLTVEEMNEAIGEAVADRFARKMSQ